MKANNYTISKMEQLLVSSFNTEPTVSTSSNIMNEPADNMNFDDLMTLLGEFGRYQRIRFSMLCIFSMVCAWHSFNMVFVGAAPKFHCDIRAMNFSNTLLEGLTLKQKEALLIPKNFECYQYDLQETVGFPTTLNALPGQVGKDNKSYWAENLPTLLENITRSKTACNNGYEFSREVYLNTITSEFHLVCKRRFWRSLAQSTFWTGRALGSLMFGQLSDRVGRRPIFFFSCLMMLLSGTGASLAPSMMIFLPFYLCQGAALAGAVLVNFTLATEMVGPRYRVMAGFTIQIVYSIGYMILSGIAFIIRDWRHLEIAITCPLIIFGAYWWYLPESMRWLVSKGRKTEAKKILWAMASTNGVTIDANIVDSLKEHSTKSPEKRKYSFFDCFRTWKMASLFLNVWFIWFASSMVFYGLSLNSENLAGNPYLNFCLNGAVEIPAYVICILILDKVGRRRPLVLSVLFGGTACIFSGFTSDRPGLGTLTIIFAILGKFGITASYRIIYLMAAEVFPTVIRNIGMGACSMSARIGAILAPFILDLQWYSQACPMYIFGGMSVLTGLLALFLPETAGKPLAQLPEDVDNGPSILDVVSCCKKRRDNLFEDDGNANNKNSFKISSSQDLREKQHLLSNG